MNTQLQARASEVGPTGPAHRLAASADRAPSEPLVLDRVTTISIGDLRADGGTIDPTNFEYYAQQIADDARHCGGTVYAVAYGNGIGSDGANEGACERSAIILVGNVQRPNDLRLLVSLRLATMGGSSACFSTDAAHEPVFATIDGRR